VNRVLAALRNLFAGRRVDRDTEEELRAYLAFSADEQERRGLGRPEAERAARLDLGGLDAVQDRVRDVRSGHRLAAMAQDLTYAVRTLVHAPAFTAAVVGVLALGIGANTAIFSIVSGVLLRPIPVPDGASLVRLLHTPPAASFPGIRVFAVSPANYLDWKAENTVFDGMAAYGLASMTLTGGDRAEPLTVARVDPTLLPLVGTQPALGRVFLPDEAQPGHGQVAVVSMGFWRGHFGDAALSGQSIQLDGERYTIVGVMPARFTWPAWSITAAAAWVPLVWTNEERAVRDNHNYQVTARLKPGVTLAQARADMDRVSGLLAQAYPKEDTGWGAVVIPLQELVVGDVRQSLFVLLGAVGFVLLIASANAANLLLGRALGRRKELAIRTALGATRRRVMQQLLVEALLIATAAGLAGALLSQVSLAVFAAFLADELPRAGEVTLDGRVLGFTIAVSLLTGLVAGLGPAWSASRTSLHDTLKQGLGRTGGTTPGRLGRRLLVGGEVALSLVLLVGAGLMIRSIQALARVDLGFDPAHVLTLTVRIPTTKYPTAAKQSQFFDQTLARMRAEPGVLSAGFVDAPPLTGGSTQPFAIVGRPAVGAPDQQVMAVRTFSPDYLKTMRIPLLRGRDVDPHDAHAVVVSQAAVRAFWPTQDPLGQQLTFAFAPGAIWDVVGVAGDVKLGGIDAVGMTATVYQWQAERPWTYAVFVVRTSGSPADMTGPLERAIHDIDPDQPVRQVSTMDDTVALTTASRRFEEQVLTLFAGIALLLAGAGLYSVLAHAVRGRAREIAVRTALGAHPASIVRLVLLEAATPTLGGLVVGLGSAALLTPALNTLVFGVGAFDTLTLASVSILIFFVACLAGLAPAYRAARLDPVRVLRDE
jgi:putative ABC transport system permease protein